MIPLFGRTPLIAAEQLKEFARTLRHFARRPLKPKAGRHPTEVNEYADPRLEEVNRSAVSRKQRQALPPAKPRGRPRKYSDETIRTVVYCVRSLIERGLTRTYKTDAMGTAFVEVARRLSRPGHHFTPHAIRNIWQQYKDQYPQAAE